jgi:hypothetical protein
VVCFCFLLFTPLLVEIRGLRAPPAAEKGVRTSQMQRERDACVRDNAMLGREGQVVRAVQNCRDVRASPPRRAGGIDGIRGRLAGVVMWPGPPCGWLLGRGRADGDDTARE